MLKKVRDYMREHEMTAPGDAVIVELSGGADSTALLRALLQQDAPVFHIQHQRHGPMLRSFCSGRRLYGQCLLHAQGAGRKGHSLHRGAPPGRHTNAPSSISAWL